MLHTMKYIQIGLPYKIRREVLALGGQSKSAFCFTKGNAAYLSDSGGDLSDLENFKKFENDIKKFQKKLKIKPKIIACDLHPEYTSTKYAIRTTNYELRTAAIQHHEAHVVSCMVDNNIKGKVIGIAFDGTGFGLDGNIWGGEFFVGDVKGLKRAAHLRYIPMPGAEASIKEPWRMAFSYLYAIYGKKRSHSFLQKKFRIRSNILEQIIDKKINTPLTSSMGRLFDGVSSLIGVCDVAGHEGEAAIKLEKIMLVTGHPSRQNVKLDTLGTGRYHGAGKYKFKYIDENGIMIIDWEPVIRDIVVDLKKGVTKQEISLKFHNTVCEMIGNVCKSLRKKYKISKVCMSGGVFQNKYLTTQVVPILEKDGFEVYLHKKIPTHDGGIALGQAVLAGV